MSNSQLNSGTIGPEDRPEDTDLLSPGLLDWDGTVTVVDSTV